MLPAIFFGALHLLGGAGITSQVPFAALIAAVALLLGKSAVATRGFGWAILVHLLFDVTLFSVIAV